MATDPKSTPRDVRRQRMSRRQFLQVTAVGGSMAALMAACAVPAPAGETGGGEPAAADAGAQSGPQYGGTMVLMGHQEVAGLSPADEGPSVQETMIRAIHDSLMIDDEYLELKPLLAESYEVSADGLTYTFKLREGVKFHDGKELTSADVKYTFEFYGNPDNATAIVNQFLGMESVDTPDDYTVVVNMSQINAAFLTSGAQVCIVQSEYHAEVGEDTYRTAPIGTGPFVLEEWRPAEVTVVVANEEYWNGRPYIDVIRQEVVPEPSVRTIALQTGDADSNLWPLLVEDSQAFAEDPNFTVVTTSTGGVKHIPLNNKIPQLAEKEVRQAMMHALDRQRIIDDLWNGAATVAHSNLSPKFAFFSRDNDPTLKRYDFDPELAKSMLDGAGWTVGDDGIREKDGLKLSFTCTTISGDQARRPIAELSQLMFLDVGIDMQLAEAPISAILDGLRGGTIEASLFNWTYGSVDPDPSNTLRSDGGQNWNSFENERMDELIDAGLATVDPEERRAIYNEIQDIFVEEVPCLYLQWDEWMNVFSSRVQGLVDNPNDAFTIYFSGLPKWWLADA